MDSQPARMEVSTYLGGDNKIQTFHISSQYPDGSTGLVLIAGR